MKSTTINTQRNNSENIFISHALVEILRGLWILYEKKKKKEDYE